MCGEPEAGCTSPVASVSTVAPVTLQRPLPATYVIPAGRASPTLIVVAVLLPLLVYVKVTVYGPLGEAPELELITLFRLSTAFEVTVVVSVLEADLVLSKTDV